MRRKDREILDSDKIDLIINNCDCCRLGFVDDDGAYILPLNFGYENKNGQRFFYFHSAKEGKKIGLIEKQSHVSFELDCNHALNSAADACGYSYRFQSVMGHGKIKFVEDAEEKRKTLNIFMNHYTEKKDWNIPDVALKGVCIYMLTVTDISCKEHK